MNTMKIYARSEVANVMGRADIFHFSAENLADVQDALDSDSDNTLRARVGWCFYKLDNGGIQVRSNDSNGWCAGGTDIFAQIA